MAQDLTDVAAGTPDVGGGLGGTVTFLFTDIEGSTRLLRTVGRSYGSLLEEHRRVLRAAFAAHGGREIDTQGDSFFVAFPGPGQAVAAAADAQRAFAAHSWPAGNAVRVRMGLHTGEATVAGGSYVGLSVHRAARIAAVAHGGQALLSEATAGLVADSLPDGTTLRSLGAHALKDFPRPAPLYQLDVAGLATDFPPLRTPVRHPRLPVPSGTLLGRDGDCAALTSLLRDPVTRLVTLTGPGGIGKTRLALDAATAVAADFPGGAVFVPLSPVVDAGLVLGTVADRLGARREGELGVVDAISAAIGDDRTLLVLDNFEQVVQAAGDVAILLDAVTPAVALVTSRTVLRLRSERQYHLAPLAEDPAVHLFAERAAAIRPGFALDSSNGPVVAEICRRLDGLPLAIELAAARTRLLPLEALLARLEERLDVLAGGPVDLPERQRTLRATMDWSYGLLAPHEQSVFARLGIFSGGWTLAAAEAVCGRPGEPPVLDSLGALLDASLLVSFDETTPEPRMHMLDTVRAYAMERLAAAPDRAETERLRTRWLVAVIDELLGAAAHEFRDGAERLDQERPNLRAGMQWLIEAGDVETAALLMRNAVGYLVRLGGEREVLSWLEQTLPGACGAPLAVRGRLLVLRALVAGYLGDFATVLALLPEGRALLPDDDEHAYDQAFAAVAAIYAAMAEGSIERAARCVEDAAARFARLHQELGVAFMVVAGGDLALSTGDLETAEQHYANAVELAGRLRDDAMTGQAMSLRGLALLARGDVEGARRSVLDGAAANRRGGQPTSIAYSLEGLAAVALADGRPAVAARALAAAAAVRSHVAAPLSPALPPLIADLAGRSREQLGAELYEAAAAEGALWSATEALDRTLENLASPRPVTAWRTPRSARGAR